MALGRAWVGRRDKPPVVHGLNASLVDSEWGWVYESLVCAWLFNEPGGDTVRDVLGRANGTRVAGTGSKPSWVRDGHLWGLRPSLAGASSGIDLPGGSAAVLGDSFTPSQLTVETWCKWGVDNGLDPRLFSKQTTGSGADHWIMVGSTDSGANVGVARFRLKTGGTTKTHIAANTTEPIAGDLVHMVWTYDGSGSGTAVLLYLNGKVTALSASGAQSGTVDGGTGVPIRIGNSAYSGASNEWDGPIYKVALYDTALTAGQIQSLTHDPYGAFRVIQRRVGLVPAAAPSGRIMSSLAHHGGLAGAGGIAGAGGGLAA